MKDHSNLPEAGAPEAFKPDLLARFAPALAQSWAKTVDMGEKGFANEQARIRHSWAGECARQLGYQVMQREGLDVTKTEPMTVADYWRLGLGTLVHERWQEQMKVAFPNAEVEVQVGIEEIPSSGHIDLVDRGPHGSDWVGNGEPSPFVVSMELKTINGFGFKQAVGAQGVAQGPRTSALYQASLNAKAIDADECVLVYLTMENLSPAMLKKLAGAEAEEWRRFAAEWTLTRAQYEPLADKEIKRMKATLRVLDEGNLPPRSIPELPRHARVTDPAKGTWQVVMEGAVVDTGRTWQCDYCSYRTRCISDGPS